MSAILGENQGPVASGDRSNHLSHACEKNCYIVKLFLMVKNKSKSAKSIIDEIGRKNRAPTFNFAPTPRGVWGNPEPNVVRGLDCQLIFPIIPQS